MEGRGESSLSCSSRSQRLIAVGPCVCHQTQSFCFVARLRGGWVAYAVMAPVDKDLYHRNDVPAFFSFSASFALNLLMSAAPCSKSPPNISAPLPVALSDRDRDPSPATPILTL
jgi:hypothetical protein